MSSEPANATADGGFPRTLHVGHQPIGTPSNSGLTLASMFGGYPASHLMEVCLQPGAGPAGAGNILTLPRRAVPVDWAVRAVVSNNATLGLRDGLNNSISRQGRSLSLTDRLRVEGSAINDIGPVVVPRAALEKIRGFEPAVIHSLLGSVRVMRLVLSLSRRLRIPILPHFMDDWPSNLYQDGQVAGAARRETNQLLAQIMLRSPALATIGSDMSAEFTSRYGKECVVVGNSVSLQESEPTSPRTLNASEIAYVGGLHLDRDKVLARFAAQLDDWNLRHNSSLVLKVYTPMGDVAKVARLACEYSSVVAGGNLNPNEVRAVLRRSGAVVFLEASDPELVKFTRLSVSTKVPQYLSSGRPILVIGPKEQGSVRALRDSGRAFYLGDDSGPLDLGNIPVDAAGGFPQGEYSGLPPLFEMGATRERLRTALSLAVRRYAGS